MPDRSNPFAQWTPEQQASIRQQLLDLLRSGKLNPAQRTSVLDSLVRANPQTAKGPASLSTGGLGSAAATGLGRGLWDVAQGLMHMADPTMSPEERKFLGAREATAGPLREMELIPTRMLWGLRGIPQVPGALRDLYQSGKTGAAAAAATEIPRLGGQVAGAELVHQAGRIPEVIPSRNRAERGFQYIDSQIGGQQVGISLTTLRSMFDALHRTTTGVSAGPAATILRNFVSEILSPQGMEFRRARNFHTDLDKAIFEKDVAKQLRKPIKEAAHNLRKDLSDTTQRYGGDRLQRIYDTANKEWGRAQKISAISRGAGEVVGPAVGGFLGYKTLGPMGFYGGGYMGHLLGHRFGPWMGGGLAELMLKRPTMGLPGVPGILPRFTRGLGVAGAMTGAGQDMPSWAAPTIPGLTIQQGKGKPRLSPAEMNHLVGQAASASHLDPRLVRVMMHQEDPTGDPAAVSPKGAIGNMQLMPGTAKDLGVTDPTDPRQNIPGGARLFRQMLDRYHGNIALALAAYNAGPGAVDKYGGIPPFPETQAYVKNIIGRYRAAMLSQGDQGGQIAPAPAPSPVAAALPPPPATSTLGAFGIPGQPPPPYRPTPAAPGLSMTWPPP